MTPELQNVMAQVESAQRHAQFISYSAYAAIIVCAIFTVLIFWKLCQIQEQLLANSLFQRSIPGSPAGSFTTAGTPPENPWAAGKEDSRYMPKG